MAASDIELVSAHGTGTPLNDRIETAVLRRVLGRAGPTVPVNSIKASLGHTMGAAAALEALMCLLSPRGLIPPTLHLEEPDPACDLDYVPAPGAPVGRASAEHLARLRRLQRRPRARGAPDGAPPRSAASVSSPA